MSKKIKNYLSQDVFSLELASVLLSGVLLATVYSLFEAPLIRIILFGLLEAVLSIPFAMLCHYTNSHRKLGTLFCFLTYGLLGIGLSGVGFRTEFENGLSFVQWLAQDIDDVPWLPGFGLVLCVGGAMFFGTVVYYFIVIRYRMGMLVVVSIIPCVLYAKAVADVNNWYLVFIAGMNIVAAILRRQYDKKTAGRADNKADNKISSNTDSKTYNSAEPKAVSAGAIIILAFTAIILIICAAIPKKSDAIFYDEFEDTFLGGDTNSQLIDASGNLSDLSGNADGFRSGSNRRLYRINGEVSYLKRQNFDIYDFENDRWYAINEYADPICTNYEWAEITEGLTLPRLQEAIRVTEELSPGFAAKYGLESLVDGERFKIYERTVTITALNFEAEYYVSPPGTRILMPGDSSEANVTWAGDFTVPEGMHDANFVYKATVTGNAWSNLEWCYIGGSVNDAEQFASMLEEMEKILGGSIDESEQSEKIQKAIATVDSYSWELGNALVYKQDVDFNSEQISDEVRELAIQLTEGYDYDWQKASAIETYFHSGDFVYDLSYYPPDNSVEYFLFKSKRGTCSDYATAYVLLARAAGLTVRYAEGYVAKQSGNSDVYYVKESNGHAYPEVYIPGAGWTVFEPTSGIVEEGGLGNIWQSLLRNINMDYELIMTIGVIVAGIAIIIIVIRLIIPFIMDKIFISNLKSGKKNATDAYIRILKKVKYGRLKKKYRKILKRDRMVKNINAYALTPAELNERFAEIGIDASVICSTVETTAYRSQEADEKKKNEISLVYKKIIAIFK